MIFSSLSSLFFLSSKKIEMKDSLRIITKKLGRISDSITYRKRCSADRKKERSHKPKKIMGHGFHFSERRKTQSKK